ncbi:MAG TPA: flavodoxin [Dehalococcoidia bacterium]|jgi:NAD(P)H dehydrogenase (quinone)|nr:NAD(P)H-dependent oxidoreductase [Dehalococcoidia bacterium]HIN35268.1 flavodoxin [Dehalococcoidia bacterium]|tara:strand:+ start:280 stop:786 length:507 start_codon:yes stop_codon:yes gene_type:complete
MPVSILVLYDRKNSAIENLARAAASGVELSGADVTLKQTTEATTADLLAADGLLLGSPNWSGITGSLKSWLDDQGDLWEDGSLAGKPAAAFTSGSGQHSGLEMTLLQMIHWMLACGMVVVGLPWGERMRVSGSYYGATAVGDMTTEDMAQARELGARLASVATKLART